MSYRPQQATPSKLTDLVRYVLRELNRISVHFATDEVEVRTHHEEPEKVYNGLMVIADGTDWDPGSGAGTYIYRDGSWRVIEA